MNPLINMEYWPIYVPSHGRAGKSKTLELLKGHTGEVHICCEKDEVGLYADFYPEFHVLANAIKPKSIAGARQSILEHARKSEFRWYWQLDDTITSLGRRPEPQAKATHATMQSLLEMQSYASVHPLVVLISPDFKHLAWSAKQPYKINTRCMVVTGTRTDTGLNYDLMLTMKEDIDYCLQHLRLGYLTILSHLHEINEVPMGKNKFGGMTLHYAKPDFHLKGCMDMIQKWPSYCKMDKMRHGRAEIKTSWRSFSPQKVVA